ncbi:hypothetical protein PVAP13_2NG050201 [Panicum virgatum]|uniref:Uncharacterized protein n=1 Tax=Panicum virgatum TaxID=38727 RepID=A0A8T0VAV2_PANVG|nr:hypothetical protein PVAP13_2NG050201 [Panicum virgatum]
MHLYHSGMNHIHQLALHRPRRSLLDLGEGELEGGIDPVQDLAPPREVGAVHDPDARVLDTAAIGSFPLTRELQNKLFVAIVEIEQLHEVVRDAVGGR